MTDLEYIKTRLTKALVIQNDGGELYVDPENGLTNDHILVDGHLNIADLTLEVNSMIEKAWTLGRESVAHDMFNPMDEYMQRTSTPNPYETE